jgi:hypothetical protein
MVRFLRSIRRCYELISDLKSTPVYRKNLLPERLADYGSIALACRC